MAAPTHSQLQDMRTGPVVRSRDELGKSAENTFFKTMTEDELAAEEAEAEAVMHKMRQMRSDPNAGRDRAAWGSNKPSEMEWARSSVGHPMKKKAGMAASSPSRSRSRSRSPTAQGRSRTAARSRPQTAGAGASRSLSASGTRASRSPARAGRPQSAAKPRRSAKAKVEEAGQDPYVQELESQVDELRRSVEMLQVQVKKQSTGVESKVQRLVQEHEHNLDVIERLIEEKKQADKEVERLRLLAEGKGAAGGAAAAASEGKSGGGSASEGKVGASAAASAAADPYAAFATAEDEGGADESAPPGDDDDDGGGGGAASAPAAGKGKGKGRGLEAKYAAKVGATSGMPKERSGEDKDADDSAALHADAERQGDWQQDAAWAERVRSAYLQDETEAERALRGPRDGGASPGRRGSKGSDKPLTQPKPFYSMTTREQLAKKSISQKRFEEEMAARKKAEEDVLRVSFKAKPIPKSTLMPKYQAMLENMEARRVMNVSARMEALKNDSAPFKGILTREAEAKQKREDKLKREQEEEKRRVKETLKSFRAKPIPAAVSAAKFHKMQEEDDRARKERVKERAVTVLASAALPPRMAMWEDAEAKKKKAAEESAKGGGKGKRKGPGAPKQAWEADMTFKPSVNTAVPNFKALQDRWNRKLSTARRGKKPTKPRTFSFEKEDRKAAEEAKIRQREHKNMLEEEAKRRPVKASKPPKSTRTGASAPGQTRSTKATELRQKLTQDLLQERRAKEARLAQEEKQRKRKMREASKALKPVIDAMEKERVAEPLIWHASGDAATAAKIEAKRKAEAQAAAQRYRDNQKRVQEAAAKRPYLFHRHVIEMEAEAAHRTALLNVAENVAAAREGGGGASGGGGQDDDLFDADEREIMGSAGDSGAEVDA